jgi:hypothetical protein
VKQELKSGAEVAFLVCGRDFARDEIGIDGFINARRSTSVAGVAITIESDEK